MIPVTEYRGQPVGVFGLGKAGQAAVQSLLAGGAEVWAWDDKGVVSYESLVVSKENTNDCRLTTKDYREWPWQELKVLVLSPGVPLTHPAPHPVVTQAHRHGVPVIGDIELLQRACPNATYIAITGTNGKSTTTTLIGHILKHGGRRVEVGGNLGTPALALAPLDEKGVYVLELSSYQLDLVRTTRFHVAVWLNITPDHLDRHGDMAGYVRAKTHIFDRQQPEDTAVIGVDDEYSREVGHRALGFGGKVVPISSHAALPAGVYVQDGMLLDCFFPMPHAQSPMSLQPISTLTGRHNWQNAAAAYAAARAVGLAPEAIYDAMRSFAGLRHRLQLVATIGGVRFINDSKATNADATSNALAPYDAIYWIAGGKPKAGGIDSLAAYFPKIVHAFLIGEAQDDFARTLEGKVPYTRAGTLEAATRQAAEMAFSDKKLGAVVLLSPACASFDQFKNFEERGDRFCALVEKEKTHAS